MYIYIYMYTQHTYNDNNHHNNDYHDCVSSLIRSSCNAPQRCMHGGAHGSEHGGCMDVPARAPLRRAYGHSFNQRLTN